MAERLEHGKPHHSFYFSKLSAMKYRREKPANIQTLIYMVHRGIPVAYRSQVCT